MNMNMKRIILVLVLISCTGLFFATGAAEKVVDKDLVFINDNPPFEQQNIEMGEWIKERIGVGFVPESYPDLTTYQTTLRQSLLSSNTAPDFFKWWSNCRLRPLYEADLLEDVSDIWEEMFSSGVWPRSAAAEVTFDGKQYAFPYHFSHWGIIYNKHVYKELGLSVPTTWEEFMNNLEAVKQSGRSGISFTLEGRWQSTLCWSEVIMKTDADLYLGLVDGSIKFSDTRSIEAMQNWLRIISYFPKDLTLPWGECYPRIISGDYTHALLGDWLLTSLEAEGVDLDKDVGWFPVPAITPAGNGFVLEISPMVIPKNSRNKEQTKQVMREWMSVEGQKKWVEIFSESSPACGGLVPDKKIFQSIVDAGLFTDKVRHMPRWYEAVPVELCEYTMDKFGEVILNPSRLKAVMQEIDDFRERM